MSRPAGKAILITGCSSGIGLACARVLKARGWRVLATARTPEDLDRLEHDVGVEALPLELADLNSVQACAQAALQRTDGQLYALFNNAAYGQVGAVEDLPSAALAQQLMVNVVAQHELTRLIIPAMREAGRGRIVQCSSVLGLVAAPFRGAYCASKFALEGLTDCMRLELAPAGIAVSLIEPGPIRTRFVEHALANFKATIDIEASPHRALYLARLAAMEAGGNPAFKLEPEAVAAKLVKAVESRRPRRRYYVTTPTYVAAILKRAAPPAVLEWMVRRM
jgi:NAD(P)-dependent dehydrogenase (short-subunit alcohol dehydrogenase family)